MPQTITIILAFIVAWFIGYETGKWVTMKKLREWLKNFTKEMVEASKKMKGDAHEPICKTNDQTK